MIIKYCCTCPWYFLFKFSIKRYLNTICSNVQFTFEYIIVFNMRISLVVSRTVTLIVGICSFANLNNVESSALPKFSISRVGSSSRGYSRSRGLGNNRLRSSNGRSSSIYSRSFSNSAVGTDFMIGDGEPWYSSSSSFSGRGSGSYRRGNQFTSSSLNKQSGRKQYQSSSSKKTFDMKNREKASSEGKVGKLMNMKVDFPTFEDKVRIRNRHLFCKI